MDKKLTLSLNQNVIEKAKDYAKQNKISLSKLIENYLQSIFNESEEDIKITPLVQSISGVITLGEDFDLKNDHADFLIEKYK